MAVTCESASAPSVGSLTLWLLPSLARCQINTTPLKKQIGCIDVNRESTRCDIAASVELTLSPLVSVPPDILDSESSKDITVNEGQNASLFCVASGNPQPRKYTRRTR